MTIRMFHLTAVAAAAAVMLAGCASAPEQTSIKDGVYTVSVIIERVRPLDFVLN